MNLWIGKKLEEKWRKKEGKNWNTDLQNAGCCILWYSSYSLKRREGKLLCITDSEEEMKIAKELGYPPIELQTQFAAFVEQTNKSKAVIQKALDKTQLLFDSLMQKYFG